MDVASPEIMYQSRSTQCTNSGLFEVDTMTSEILAFKAGRAGSKREKHAYCSMHVQDTTNTTPRIISLTVVLSSCCLSLSLPLSLSFSPSLSLSLPLPHFLLFIRLGQKEITIRCAPAFFFSAFLSPSSLKYQVPRMRFPEQCELLLLVVVVVSVEWWSGGLT